jgi:hypothetical protein
MRRFMGAVLAGLGALLIVLAIGLPIFVAPAVAKLPYNLTPCKTAGVDDPKGCLQPSVATADGATFLQIDSTGLHINTATLQNTTEVVPQAKLTADQQAAGKINSNTVIWDTYSTTVRTDTQAVISKSASELAIDRSTGAADPNWDGQWLDESGGKDYTVRFTGQEFNFPFGTQKSDYTYFDDNLRTASTIKFSSVETIAGIETYHFVQETPDTELTLDTANRELLRSSLTPTATSVKVTYHDNRELWIAPATGQFIRVWDHQVKTLVPDTGSPVVLLDGNFKYTPATEAHSAESAKSNTTQLKLVKLYGPVGFGVLGLVLLLVGLLLGRGGRQSEAAAGGFDDSLPEPRHRLRGEDGTYTDATAGGTERRS